MAKYLQDQILLSVLQREKTETSELPISALCGLWQTELKGAVEETFVLEVKMFQIN